jgi:hypothetical protein
MNFSKLPEIAVKAWFRTVTNASIAVLPPPAGTFPQSYIRSIEELLYCRWLASHVDKVFPVLPAKVENYDYPDSFPTIFRRQKAYDALNAFLLKDVVFDPLSGGIWLPGGQHFLGESFGSVRRVMFASYYRHRFWGEGERIRSDQVFVPLCGHNYYHVMMEELPRALVALSLVPDACLVVSPEGPAFLQSIAERVLETHPRCTLRRLSRKSRMERLLLVPAHEHSGFTRSEQIAKVRGLFPGNMDAPADKKLYLSRRWASDRAVSNEDEIERLFRQNGFEIVYLERVALVDQWKLLNSARMVTGFSGAGMTNVMFCRPGTRICCIFRPGDFIDCFARISVQSGHRYSYVMGQPCGQNGIDAEDVVSAAMKNLNAT